MSRSKVIVEKWQVLWVLQNGSLEDAQGIRENLRKCFGVDCRLNSLRKNLGRCVAARLLERPRKRGRRHLYRITGKGIERLIWVVSKKIDKISKSPQPKQTHADQDKKKLEREWMEITSVLGLCEKSLKLCKDKETADFVRCSTLYWLRNFQSIVPHLDYKQIWATMRLIENCSKQVPEEDYQTLLTVLYKRKAESVDFMAYMWEQERNEKERYRRLYEEEKAKKQRPERQNLRQFSIGFDLGRKLGVMEAKINALSVATRGFSLHNF